MPGVSPRTVLVVSSGRTGTQFLAHYFDANFEGVAGLHEPAPRYRLRLAVNAYAAGALSRVRMRQLLVRRRARIERRLPPATALYVESNPFLWGAVDLFAEVFDSPTLVHVVRDPREQVRSSLGHGTAKGRKALANRFLPYWYPKLPGATPGGDWLARAAALWTVVNQRLSEHGPGCGDYRLVRYEDLFDDSHSGLRVLCEHLGLEYFAGAGAEPAGREPGTGAALDPSQRMNQAEADVVGGWAQWSDARCATLARIAGPWMERYGYGQEPDWQERVARGERAGSRS